ncbi:MAG: TMEM175 family protein [Myxococcota bacterium]
MVRATTKNTTEGECRFRWRSPNVSRIENLADIIFALALALIGTMDLPRSAAELAGMWRSLLATGLCFGTVFVIWNAHYTFFRRYDLMDGWTVFLNSVLLFVVFGFAYPLKFLMDFLVEFFTLGFDSAESIQEVMTFAQARWVLILYSVGYAMVFGVFAALYRHALNDADRMELTPTERVLTRASTEGALVHVCAAVLVITSALLLPPFGVPLAGALYFLIWPALQWIDRRQARTLAHLGEP